MARAVALARLLAIVVSAGPLRAAEVLQQSPRDSNDRLTVSPFGEDARAWFNARGAAIWSPIVDQFLSARALVTDAAPASGPKRILTPAGLDARGEQAFAIYLDSGPNKAFAVGEGDRFGWAFGRLSSEEARRAALDFCAKGGAPNCAIVNLNGDPTR